MDDNQTSVNKTRFLFYQVLKTFAIIFGFLTFINWVMGDPVYLLDNLLLAVLITGGITVPVFSVAKLLIPVFAHETVTQRRTYFREHFVAFKLMAVVSLSIALFFVLLRILVPVFGLLLWQVGMLGLGLGIILGVLITGLAWYLSGRQRPPFSRE